MYQKDQKVRTGLYTKSLEKDSCGVGMIADLNGSHQHVIVDSALTILENMKHRGASGFETNTGDGAGILTQLPHDLLNSNLLSQGLTLPPMGKYGLGMFFLPLNKNIHATCMSIIKRIAKDHDFEILFIREVPTDASILGESAKKSKPEIKQIIFKSIGFNNKDIERRLYFLRNSILKNIYTDHQEFFEDFYISSLSSKTVVYKGLLTATQLRLFYKDLQSPEYRSAIAIVHSRFSTNTLPKWKLAQPFRCIAHNGEINTIKGNQNWWKSREHYLEKVKQEDPELIKIFPVCDPAISDSGNFDNVVDFLQHASRSIPHSMMMMIPESWQNDLSMPNYKRAFYEYHDGIMEPWDGPASICFTDGTLLGAIVDRNGLRPSRYLLTKDNLLILGSEAGCINIEPERIAYKGRLDPGKILVADLDEKRIIPDQEVKERICKRKPYQKWLDRNSIHINNVQVKNRDLERAKIDLKNRQIAFGFNKEDEEMILSVMSGSRKVPVGSMGSDIPLAVLSKISQHPSNYFKQHFAQVTNPPIDPIRESFYMSLKCSLGAGSNIIRVGENESRTLKFDSPIIDESILAKLIHLENPYFESHQIQTTFQNSKDLKSAIIDICRDVEFKVRQGINLIRLTDRFIDKNHINAPSLLVCGAVHQHLIDVGLRKEAIIIVDCGDIWESHHFACLISLGADLICPYLAIETCQNLSANNHCSVKNYLRTVEKGILKIMSKLGISTLNAYKGAQTFEALGISSEVIEMCCSNVICRLEGMTFSDLDKENRIKHRAAFSAGEKRIPDLGIYRWNKRGEYHLFNPTTIHLLQHACKKNDYSVYKKFSKQLSELEFNNATLRSYFSLKTSQKSIPISEVEPVANILKRFATGAMSFGSISSEAHTALARAMNAIGGKSNSGEGGEDSLRFNIKPDSKNENSAIKQIASGRFGVTAHYLSSAKELQIKMAQGAKPGEGGQLPGHKVNTEIAKVRHSTPGVGLISPPPHHDIYSIEDLAQLIFDLKNANQKARISVKLVSKAGVGVIASGVVKAHAEHILISGADGGTGASPLSSIRHAGIPWELGLAETHQTLVKNGLRDRVVLQADGQIRTGRDLAIATILGAEEWGIATAALVVQGCILMRKCHLNTCPVGIATQDELLRKKFNGKSEHLINYFNFLAQELRSIMAALGVRTINELVGRTELLDIVCTEKHWKTKNLQLECILTKEQNPYKINEYASKSQDHSLNNVLDIKLIKLSKTALINKKSFSSRFKIANTDRAVGTMFSYHVGKIFGEKGAPHDHYSLRFTGSAGQSFGAFAVKGLTLSLSGEANDYFGKGLCGAKLSVKPPKKFSLNPENNIIIGNVALYGATSGMAFINGRAGDRFAVRNSGAIAVVEGIGANGCEYMTGGKVIILGSIGSNFGAGMSGGYVIILKESVKDINSTTLLKESLSDAELFELQNLIRAHANHTGSKQALEILYEWGKRKFDFLKVVPQEFKEALARINQTHIKKIS